MNDAIPVMSHTVLYFFGSRASIGLFLFFYFFIISLRKSVEIPSPRPEASRAI